MIIADINVRHNKVSFRQGQEVTATDKFPQIEIQRLLKKGYFKEVANDSPAADKAREIAKQMKVEADKEQKKTEDREKEEKQLEDDARKAQGKETPGSESPDDENKGAEGTVGDEEGNKGQE